MPASDKFSHMIPRQLSSLYANLNAWALLQIEAS